MLAPTHIQVPSGTRKRLVYTPGQPPVLAVRLQELFGLSDTPKSPIITLSDRYMVLDIEGVSFVDPFAQVIAFLGALVHE